MTSGTYIATLISEHTSDELELELIGGLPQKSFVRTGDVDGAPVDVIWELDPSSPEHTYRPASGDGYGEGGTR